MARLARADGNRSHPGEPSERSEARAVGQLKSTISGHRRKSSSGRPMAIGRGGRANRQQPMGADGAPAAHGRRSTPHDRWATAGNQRPGTGGPQSGGNDKRPTTRGDGQRPTAGSDG